MSRGTRLRTAYADTRGCEACKHCRPSMLFTLCIHPSSMHTYAGTPDFHTVQHMRDVQTGECGSDMKLRELRESE